jgi:UDP-N-acetylmuramoylalanine--D-glutamate ligase
MRVAVAGLGVSGRAVCRAVKELGGVPVGFDQKPAETPALIKAADELSQIDVECVIGWHGRLDPAEFDLLVVSPGFPSSHPALIDMSDRPVWGEIEFAWRISKAPIAAITGTNGKSTVTSLTWTLLQAEGIKARLCGNIAGSGFPEVTLTQAALEAAEDEVLCAEISSFQLEFALGFRPAAACITNLADDHLDRHASIAEYHDLKLRLFRQMGIGDTIVINGTEGSVTEAMARERTQDAKIISFGTSDAAPFGGQELDLEGTALFGEFGRANALMAWHLAAAFAPMGEEARQAILDFPGLANRAERLGEKDGVLLINTTVCTNPAALIATAGALPMRQHILIGGKTKGLDFAPVGDFLKETGHQAVIFGPEPEAMNEAIGGHWPICSSMQEAFDLALSSAKPGEAVHLAPACAGADPYPSFRERGEAFRAMAAEAMSQ